MNFAQTFFTTTAYRLYLAVLFLVPTAIVFGATIPLQGTKMLIAALGLIGALAFAVLGSFKRGGLMVPMNWLLVSVWLLPIVYAVSAVFAPSFVGATVGTQIDPDTVVFMAFLALSASLPLYIFSGKSDTARAFFVLLAASWIVALFHLVRLFFGPDVLSFGVFTSSLFSPLGKWNDVSIFFGLVSLLVLITLESLPLAALQRGVLMVTLAVSLFFVALVNFVPVWVVLAVITLGVVLYRFLVMGRASSRFSVASIIVFVLAVVAIVFSASLGAGLGRTFGVEQIEARPSWGSTLSIASETLSESPVVGSGPNTFVLQWDKYRPQLLNTSVFWNADFTSGVGFIPTAVVTTGLLGALAWALVLLFFLLSGIRGLLLRPFADPSTYHLALTAFVGALYILVMSVLYLPSPALLIVCFALMGMYLALYHHEGGGRTIDIDFRVMPRTGFVAVLVLALTLVVSLMSVFGLGTVFASNVVFERGVRAAQVAGDLDGAIALIDTANSLHSTDRYYRFATLLHVAKINQILADTGSTPEAELQAKFQTELGAAVEGGLKAVSLNTRDYRNWQSVGGAYQSVVPLNIDGAYDAAMSAFGNAAALNPLMPTIPLARAQIELARENQKAARVALNEALALKEDFVPALLLIAQIELTNGNLREAIKRAESASLFEPSNPVTRFQVGVLKFENRDYKGAEEAFAAAVQLAPDYANARYYLGRTYLKRGAETKALAEFEEVLRRNPDSSDVQAVMSAIEAGRDPFAPATADDTE